MLIFVSCGTVRNVFDESIPLEQTVIVENNSGFRITHVNGTAVNFNYSRGGNTEIRLPAGNVELTITINFADSAGFYNIRYHVPSAKFNYNYIVGNKYRLGFYPRFDKKSLEFDEEQFISVNNRTTRTREYAIIIEN